MEHPSRKKSIIWDLCQGLRLVISTYLLSWTTSRNGPKCTPFRDQEAPTVAEAVVQHWISRYGVPLQLHSDQGRNFVSAVLKGVCELLGIDKTKTTHLCTHTPFTRLPDIHHPRCFLAEIFVSPCDLLFGRPPDTPSSPEEYVQNLQARFEDVHNLARERDQPEDGEDEDSVRHKKPQDINSRKVTRCGSTTRLDAKDFLLSYNRIGTVLIQF
ncbi:retrovirus-related Pol polyprotein from transposon 412 [Trichonephila clavipes]|nr:retrovirus-related Pol polyprotein from transposon 412 [Trichonephila clavipes]